MEIKLKTRPLGDGYIEVRLFYDRGDYVTEVFDLEEAKRFMTAIEPGLEDLQAYVDWQEELKENG